MSFAFGEIRQERSDCYAVFYEGGPGIECRRYDKQFPSFDEAWEWVRAKHLEVMTPKVKKTVEPVYVSELELPDDPDLLVPVSAAQWQALTEAAMNQDAIPAYTAPVYEPNTAYAPKAAETATGDQAGSAEAPAPRQKRQYRKRGAA